MEIATFLNKINAAILNPLILLAFSIAFLVFFVGVIQFIISRQSETNHEEANKRIIYGLIGMFVMFSAYGIIHLILGTFHIQQTSPSYITF